jgi:hypothetical protein
MPVETQNSETTQRKLNKVKISPESTRGGKRAGAGRKRDFNSVRYLCERMKVSPYMLRRVRLILELAPDLRERMKDGSLSSCGAIKIIRKRLAAKGEVLVANSYDRRLAEAREPR